MPTPLSYPSRAMNREDVFWYLLALTLPLFLVGYGLWQSYLGYVQFGPAAMTAWSQPWFIAGAWAVIPLFILTLRAVRFARREVQVVEKGLILTELTKNPLPWKNLHGLTVEDVRYHFLTLTLRTRRRVRLIPTTGRPLTLDDRFRDLAGLAETIKAHLYPLLLPELRKQLQTNQWVYFGPLRFNRTELDPGSTPLPWTEITSLSVHAGYLLIERPNRLPLRLPTAKIPNVELLLQLVEEMYTG